MTARANSLTDRDESAAARGRPLSSISPFFDAFARLGYDRETLIEATGLRAEELADPDARLSDAACERLFGDALRQRKLPNLGLRLAAEIPIGAFPLLDYVILTSDTVGEGIRHLARYLKLSQSPTEIQVREAGSTFHVIANDCGPFSIEFGLSLPVFHFRRETDGKFCPLELRLRHRPDDPAEFERLLDCRLATGCATDELVIARSTWKLPLRRRDTVLHGVLRRHADEILKQPKPGLGFAAEVRRALVSRVAGGDTRLAALARHLGASPRSLQRRLEAEGRSYHELLDDTRRDAAESYLRGSALSCAEVGYLLGFSEPAAFTRAFKRWRGLTPLEFRRATRA